jgi:hypothetical protein
MGDVVLNLLGTQSTREESMMDRTASAGFEGIAQMLLEQKKLMDALESENRELRRQLADLRRGVGIAIVIEGKTIQLASDSGANGQSPAALQSLQSMQNTPAPTMSQSSANSYNNQNGRSTNSQPSVNEKRDNNVRSPLADSFVL